MQNKKWFTLVELIVVIVILSILWTIWFISLIWFWSNARDSKRMSDLWLIGAWLEIYSAWNYVLPIPENSVTVWSWTTDYTIQWYAWEDILNLLEISIDAKDPSDQEFYTYVISENKKNFQLMAYLENDTNNVQVSSNLFFPNTFADYWDRFPYLAWDSVWVFVDPINWIPIHKLSTNIDLSSDNNQYTIFFDMNENQITSSWSNLSKEIIANNPYIWEITWSLIPWSNNHLSCNDPIDVTSSSFFNFDINTQTITWYDNVSWWTDVVIPCKISWLDVLAIWDSAFWNLNLTSVILPNTIDYIGLYSFEENLLKEIIIPNWVKTIWYSAFWLNELSSITLPQSINSLWDYSFNSQSLVNNWTIYWPSLGYVFDSYVNNPWWIFDKSTHPNYISQ